ncbi:ion channel [Rhodovulum imhoffii]|uniref:Ion channel n=1 Tax=Rhodovulum imhoffii TaxID=365340 RepID=A0A2T5BNI6_9RHOB|nr:potassium channel family protein [Rhodovulum imhoffii]MBK5933136.1 hypothetical protein [Rhodovulum imhoffii]PTN00545.1 ion channel [Rhodovulum imhoffii]
MQGPHLFGNLIDGTILVAVTVTIHVLLFAGLVRLSGRVSRRSIDSFGRVTLLVCGMTVIIILAHIVEIQIWGAYYNLIGFMQSWEEGFYFSAVTYATIGYGDIVPPPELRTLAAAEGLTGILMCSLSGGLIFAVVSHIIEILDKEARM